jgi:hypothetical protein
MLGFDLETHVNSEIIGGEISCRLGHCNCFMTLS